MGNLNNIICKVVSSMTAALRFDGELNVDMNEFQTNLVPFPRLHFMTTSLAPVISVQKADHEAHDCRRITDDCLQSNSFLVKYSDFDVVEDKYMAISVNSEVTSNRKNPTASSSGSNNKEKFPSSSGAQPVSRLVSTTSQLSPSQMMTWQLHPETQL